MIRELTNHERQLILKLLERPFQGHNALKRQLLHAKAKPTGDSDNYGSIYLKVTDKNKADTINNLPVEGMTHDSDGAVVDILLHTAEGYLDELEIVKYGTSNKLLTALDPAKIEVKVNNDPLSEDIPSY